MRALGLVPSLVKPGVKVTMRVHPVKDRRRGGSFIDIRFPDGKYINQRGGG
jgi:hypothetical protein